jgi:hypothetical protein
VGEVSEGAVEAPSYSMTRYLVVRLYSMALTLVGLTLLIFSCCG